MVCAAAPIAAVNNKPVGRNAFLRSRMSSIKLDLSFSAEPPRLPGYWHVAHVQFRFGIKVSCLFTFMKNELFAIFVDMLAVCLQLCKLDMGYVPGYSQSRSNPSKLCSLQKAKTLSTKRFLRAGSATISEYFLLPSFQPPMAMVTYNKRCQIKVYVFESRKTNEKLQSVDC